jgi:hypothetical protein
VMDTWFWGLTLEEGGLQHAITDPTARSQHLSDELLDNKTRITHACVRARVGSVARGA